MTKHTLKNVLLTGIGHDRCSSDLPPREQVNPTFVDGESNEYCVNGLGLDKDRKTILMKVHYVESDKEKVIPLHEHLTDSYNFEWRRGMRVFGPF